MFHAILLNKNEDGTTKAELTQLNDAQLPEDGDVTVAVDYSTINYKDGVLRQRVVVHIGRVANQARVTQSIGVHDVNS